MKKMKKIIALVLVLASVLTLGACGKQKKALKALAAIQANSDPTKVIINTEQTYGAHKMIGETTFVKGTSDGRRAMVYIENYQSLSEIEDQANSYIESTKTTYEYLDGKGVRINGGKWDATRTDFAYQTNVINLNLAKDFLTEITSEDNKLTAIIPSSATDDVFGTDSGLNVDSDVSITVIHDGIVITSITLSYTVAATGTIEHDMQVTISASYSYDAETITIIP